MFGYNKMEKEEFVIVPQTKIAFIGYLLLLVAQVIMMYTNQTSFNKQSTLFFIVYILAATLGLYVINCTVLGKCNLYAWIMGYVLLILGIIVVLSIVYKMWM
jgi:hypothetical protein